jgi:hypothetical protein
MVVTDSEEVVYDTVQYHNTVLYLYAHKHTLKGKEHFLNGDTKQDRYLAIAHFNRIDNTFLTPCSESCKLVILSGVTFSV